MHHSVATVLGFITLSILCAAPVAQSDPFCCRGSKLFNVDRVFPSCAIILQLSPLTGGWAWIRSQAYAERTANSVVVQLWQAQHFKSGGGGEGALAVLSSRLQLLFEIYVSLRIETHSLLSFGFTSPPGVATNQPMRYNLWLGTILEHARGYRSVISGDEEHEVHFLF